jgi:hypothetical protein
MHYTTILFSSLHLSVFSHLFSFCFPLSVARTLYFLDTRTHKNRIIELLSSDLSKADRFTYREAEEIYQWLNETIKDSTAADAVKAEAAKRFPYALAFGAQPQLPPEDASATAE